MVDVLYDDGEVERDVPSERVRMRAESNHVTLSPTLSSPPSHNPRGMISVPSYTTTTTTTTISCTEGPGAGIRLSAGEHGLTVTFTPTDSTLSPVVSLTRPLRVRKAITRVCWPQPSPVHVCEGLKKGVFNGYIVTLASHHHHSNPDETNDNSSNNNAIVAASSSYPPSSFPSPSSPPSSFPPPLPRGLSASFLQYSSVGLYSATVPDEVGIEQTGHHLTHH